ncbi:MAG: hypothetical protein ACRYFZ_01335 [Janthinobacterium lividum]
MTQEEATRLVGSIYDSIFDTITKAAPGNKPLMPPATTMLSLAKPAIAITAKDFRNPWTPGNPVPAGIPAALNTAALVDDAIKFSGIYTLSGVGISEIYKQIMDSVHIKAQAPNPANDKQLDDAFAVLYRKVEVTDSETGEKSMKTVESTLLTDYNTNWQAYTAAQSVYTAAYLEAQKTLSGKSTWPMMAPSYQVPVKVAYDKWRSNYADKVEQAQSIMTVSSQNGLSKAFHNAQEVFESYGAVLEDTDGGMAKKIYRSTLLPSDWYSLTSAGTWATFDSKTSNTSTTNSSDYTAGGGSAGFSLGIFSVGGGGGHSTTSSHMDTATTDISVTFSYKLVTIRRPWLTFSLFGTQGWDMTNLYKKGSISNGSKVGQSASKMALLPTSFVVVKGVTIKAKWSQKDRDFIKKQTNAGGGFGIGPFQISGSYAHSSSKETFTSSIAGDSIIVPGVQIIGWVSQVVPYSPSL